MLIYVTGAFGSGKTTGLMQLVEEARAQGVSTAGVICPAVFENGEKTAIDAMLLPSKECLRFADRAPDDGVERECMWLFHDAAFERINAHLAQQQGELLIIDEIGPQEMVFKRGFTQALEILDTHAYTNALVVIRPSLIDEAQKRWGNGRVINMDEKGAQLKHILKQV